MHADADWHTHGSKASLDVAGKNKRRHARASAEYAWCGWRETGASMGESLTRSITLHTHTHTNTHTHTHTSPMTLAQSHMPLEQQLQCRSYVCSCVCACVRACVCISIAHALGTSASVPLRRRRPLLPPRRPAPQI